MAAVCLFTLLCANSMWAQTPTTLTLNNSGRQVFYLEQNKIYTPSIGYDDSWYIDPDYFEVQEGGNLKFLAVDGDYTIRTYDENKFYRVYKATSSSDKEPATLQNDGSGAIWVIGPKGSMAKPKYTSGTDWSTGWENDFCMAEVSSRVYQITLTVGEQLNANNVNFKFFGQAGWGAEFKQDDNTKPYLTCTDEVFYVGGDGNVHLNSGQVLKKGWVCKFTIDLNSWSSNTTGSMAGLSAPLTVTIDKSNEILPAWSIGGLDIEGGAYVNLTQGETYEIKGTSVLTDGMADGTWYIDPDFFEVVDNTHLKFKAVTGQYFVNPNTERKFYHVYVANGSGSPQTLQGDGTGAIWMTGDGESAGKPNYSYAENWVSGNVNGRFSMAPVEPTKHQMTLTVGKTLNREKVNFKFFSNQDWGDISYNKSSTSSVLFSLESGNVKATTNTLTDGDTYRVTISYNDGYVLDIHQLATVSAAGWATFTPRDKVVLPAGVNAYIVKVEGDKAKLTAVNVIPAGTPVAINAVKGDYEWLVTADAADVVEANELLEAPAGGVPVEADGYYVLANGENGVGFYQVNTGTTIPAGKAYLQVASAARAHFIGFDSGDTTTGISEMNVQKTVSGAAYNLAGQKVSAQYRGIMIENGKKVLKK